MKKLFFIFSLLIVTWLMPVSISQSCSFLAAVPSNILGSSAVNDGIRDGFGTINVDDGQCVAVLPESNSVNVLASVQTRESHIGLATSSVIIPLLTSSATASEQAERLLKPLVGFNYHSGTELAQFSIEKYPVMLSQNNIVVLAVVPMQAQFAMWNSDSWNGDFASNSARYDRIRSSEVENVLQNYNSYFGKPLSLSPYYLIANADFYRSVGEASRLKLLEAAAKVTVISGETVDRQATKVTDSLKASGLNSLQVKQLPMENSLFESSRRYLHNGGLAYQFFQCSSGTCPCGGSSSCSRSCCNN